MQFDAEYLVALGSNATSRHGYPVANVEKALRRLDGDSFKLAAASRLYRTPFVPAGTAPDVINAVARVTSPLDPQGVLDALHRIEATFDRERQVRWGERTLDLDLILAGDTILPDRATWARWHALPPTAQRERAPDQLILPHPRLTERAFVLVPAVDIAPDWRHPVLGRTLAELLAALPREEVAQIRPVSGEPA